jgi:hypothetical protein
MPFVPALFKALAGDPDVLLPAWLQARALYDDPRAAAAAAALRQQCAPRLDFVPTAELREAVRPFLEELPSMLLTVSSLWLTLEGDLPPQDLPASDLPLPGAVPAPEFSDRGEHPLFAEIGAVYGTRHLPSIFRTLADRGLLEEAWHAIGPYLSSPAGLALVADLRATADGAALAFPGYAFFRAERARPVLAQFREAVPRNLVFAAAASAV